MKHEPEKTIRGAEPPWAEDAQILRLANRANKCTVLGPGCRAVVWVQGCSFRCPGCVSRENIPFRGGQVVEVAQLAAELAALPDIEGVTFSGGEPMDQAAPLVRLVDLIRERRDLSFMCYSGYLLKHLQEHGSSSQQALVERMDILIDGPYVAARHTNLRWRGSENQQVHLLTPRYRKLEPQLHDRGNWLEFVCESDREMFWMGVPPQGFREALERQMQSIGIGLTVSE